MGEDTIPIATDPGGDTVRTVVRQATRTGRTDDTYPQLFPIELRDIPREAVRPEYTDVPECDNEGSTGGVEVTTVPEPLLDG